MNHPAGVGDEQRADVFAALVADLVSLQIEPPQSGVFTQRLCQLPRAVVVDFVVTPRVVAD